MTSTATTSPLLPDLEISDALLTDTMGKTNEVPVFKANAHIHLPPNFTAFDTVEQAVHLASAEGLRVLGASNYYDYDVYRSFAALAQESGIFPLFGLEIITLIEDLRQSEIKINDPGNPGKMYLCGKGITVFDPMSDAARELLAVIRDNDAARMAEVTTKLAEVFTARGISTTLDADAIRAQVAARHGCPVETVYLQERHLAQAFQEELFARVALPARPETLASLFGVASANPDDAVTVQGEIRSHLMKAGKAAFAPETFVGFDHAYRLILALGGIPCYPTLADGAKPICPYEEPVEHLIADLKQRGVYCAEFIPTRNAPDVLSRYVLAMRRAGMVVTAGTEHNTLDLVPLEPTCLKGEAIPPEIAAIFREGACVVAAHQYRVLHGKSGFVDNEGHPDPAFPTDDARVAAFAMYGAEVLRRYQEMKSA